MSKDIITTRQISGHIAFQGTAEDHERWASLDGALQSAAKTLSERRRPSRKDG